MYSFESDSANVGKPKNQKVKTTPPTTKTTAIITKFYVLISTRSIFISRMLLIPEITIENLSSLQMNFFEIWLCCNLRSPFTTQPTWQLVDNV